MSLGTTGFELSNKRTRKREFLDEVNRVVSWAELVSLIAPHAPAGKTRRPPFAVETMLRIHFLQQWYNLSDPAVEEALYDMPLFQQFAGLDPGTSRLPDESTILRFRHLHEEHDMAGYARVADCMAGTLMEQPLDLLLSSQHYLRIGFHPPWWIREINNLPYLLELSLEWAISQ
jgi:hypothetical protein